MGIEACRGPGHPLVGDGAFLRGIGPQSPGSISRGHITDDGIALPDDHIAIDKSRDAAMRVHGQVRWVLQAAEITARVDPRVGQLQLLQRP
jgi:hypothetical protein